MVPTRPLLALLLLGGCAAGMPPPSTPTALVAALSTEPPPTGPPPTAGRAPEEGHAGVIAGVITDRRTKERLSDSALVILQGDAIESTRETQTNENGLYAFRDLPPGTYTVQVLAGMDDVSKVIELPADAKFRANFRVDPESQWIVCRLPGMLRPALDESLFSISEREGQLLGVPRTKIRLP